MALTNLIKKIVKGKNKKKDVFQFANVEESTILSYSGNDVVEIQNLSRSKIDLGDNNDTLTVTGPITDSIISLGTGNNIARLGETTNTSIFSGYGSDSITIKTLKQGSVSLGSGNDTLTLIEKAESNTLIKGGKGFDKLILKGNTAAPIVYVAAFQLPSFQIGNADILLDSIENVVTNDGITASISKKKNNTYTVKYSGTAQGDYIFAKSFPDLTVVVASGAGDDTIDSSVAGQATIDGGIGFDVVISADLIPSISKKGWTLGSADRATQLKNVERVEYGDQSYDLREKGAVIRSKTTGLQGTNGEDTYVGSAKDDLFYLYPTQGVDVVDCSAGGRDRFNIFSFGYGPGTINVASIFGAKRNATFLDQSDRAMQVKSDTRQYTNGIATSGSLIFEAATDSFLKLDFIATKPVT